MKMAFQRIATLVLIILATVSMAMAQQNSRSTAIRKVVIIKPGTPSNQVHFRTPLRRNHVWIDGHYKWHKRSHSYVWEEGHQIRIRKGKLWVPGQWKSVPGGWIYVPGFWA